MYDHIILNGLVIDGTGAPGYQADVGISDGRIASIGRLEGASASNVIKAAGLAVCPGFVDVHSHSDLAYFAQPQALPRVMQGITTELVGNCGLGVAPVSSDRQPGWRRYLCNSVMQDVGAWQWQGFGEYLDRLEAAGPAVNVAAQLTHGAVRHEVLGMENRTPSAGEMAEMKRLIRQSMKEGAVGMSTGLEYHPCVFASTEELVELYRVVADCGGFLNVHLRNQGFRLLEAIDEMVGVARSAGIPLHVSHLFTMGRRDWNKVYALLDRLDTARSRGLELTFDLYPYDAGSTMLASVLPPWVIEEAGAGGLAEHLRWREVRARIRRDLDAGPSVKDGVIWESPVFLAGWEGIFIASVAGGSSSPYVGKTVAQIAAESGTDPVDVAMDLLVEARGGVTMLILGQNDEDAMARVMQHPASMFGTDAVVVPGKPHPRLYGSSARLLARFVRERGTLILEEAIHKMTLAGARRLGLADRGTLQEGIYADVVVFDPGGIADRTTYLEPQQFPVGIHHVFVNGTAVVKDGSATGARPGIVLRRIR